MRKVEGCGEDRGSTKEGRGVVWRKIEGVLRKVEG